ncbi:NUDIX domain-containing protein [Streptomyces sp. NPDC054835]|uniref:NUDIX domain-containing protein n=1 Tax=Streptomyces exfoliatus TaxID=1905 RepID=UPI00321FADC5
MKQRVRAVLVTPSGTTLVIKRIRPGVDPYWVIVGGGVEESDATREEALLREVREEIAGDAEIVCLLHEMENTRARRSSSTWPASTRGTSRAGPARSSPGPTGVSASSRKSRSPIRPSLT